MNHAAELFREERLKRSDIEIYLDSRAASEGHLRECDEKTSIAAVVVGQAADPALGQFDRVIITAAMEQIPDALTARLQPDGFNPGAGYIRLALVQDSETTAQALHRLVETLG